MNIVANQASPTSASFSTSGASLRMSRIVAGVRLNQQTISDYAATETLSGTTTSTTSSLTLSGNENTLGQFTYTVRTLAPFVNSGNDTPDSGSLIVRGAPSSVTITAVNASSVRLDYSAPGDGVITQSTTLDWPAFYAAL